MYRFLFIVLLFNLLVSEERYALLAGLDYGGGSPLNTCVNDVVGM